MKYISVAEVQAVEREADASGLSYAQMMENAGRNLAAVIAEVYAYADGKKILGLVGSGNNGGDTLVALTHLARQGWQTSAYILRPRSTDDPLIQRLLEAGGKLARSEDDPKRQELSRMLHDNAFWLDGVLGTGARLPLKPELAQEMSQIRKMLQEMPEPPVVIAVDCPSGVDCDSGEAAPECLPAALTVTMAAIKQGLLKFPAYDLCGDIRLVDIGLPDGGERLASWQAIKCQVIDEDWMRAMLPLRPNNAHKGTFGTALVVAGSLNYTGAALLAGQAAYRAGAGLVTLAVPSPLHSALSGQFPEATWLLLPH
ncbi:MAG: NAD(P)H-hydrate epimerase, partial [Anaerolineales bacterium]|nr:NAD(P)H-hydrate epimerase [Anaerolineales bacterium]